MVVSLHLTYACVATSLKLSRLVLTVYLGAILGPGSDRYLSTGSRTRTPVLQRRVYLPSEQSLEVKADVGR